MPDRVLRPRLVICVEYALLMTAGMLFQFTEDSESLAELISGLGNVLTAVMLVLGGIIGFIGSLAHRYSLEVAAYPFLIAVWGAYTIAVFVAANKDQAPMGFAALLGAGAAGIIGRGIELRRVIKVAHALDQRQRGRALEQRQRRRGRDVR